jgi:hypothetical protein
MSDESQLAPGERLMADVELIRHFKQLGYHPDGLGFIREKEAAEAFGMTQKDLYRLRKDEMFDDGEARRIGGQWRYLLNALRRIHAERQR